MSALKKLTMAALLAIAAMTFTASPTLAAEGRATSATGDLAARAERAGLIQSAQWRARRCRRRCAQRRRECYTERRCGYTTGCRNVRICRSVCLYWENYCR
jgi:hypothetical protein